MLMIALITICSHPFLSPFHLDLKEDEEDQLSDHILHRTLITIFSSDLLSSDLDPSS